MSTLEFNEISIDNVDLIREYLSYDDCGCSDYTVGFVMMWKKTLNLTYALSNGMLIIKGSFFSGRERFYMPCGNGDFEKAIDAIKGYCEQHNIPVEFVSIAPSHFDRLKGCIKFEYAESRDYFDYVYSAEDLALLKGRKYHQKRNHISKFKKSYSYSYNLITPENLQRVKDFYDEFIKNNPAESASEKIERESAYYALDNIEKLGMIGAFLEVDEKVVAFTIGEVKGDCLYVHVEKADREFDGSYTTINNEFVIDCVDKFAIKWVNREDDSGDEGLRKAKLSYNPDHFAEKGRVSLIV